MFILVDLVVLAILLLCIFNGYKRGLTGSLIKIFSFLIAIVVAFMLFKPVSNIVVENTEYDENLQSSIVQVFEKDEEEENKNEETTSPIVQYISDEVKDATEEKKNEIVTSVAQQLSIKIINVLVFIALFILARIALIFVKTLSNLITKLPLIKQCDKIGGVIYGLLQGLVIIFISFAIITYVATITQNYTLIEMINKSYISSILFKNNILLNIFF